MPDRCRRSAALAASLLAACTATASAQALPGTAPGLMAEADAAWQRHVVSVRAVNTRGLEGWAWARTTAP
jgi:outer membrane biogenesis lipoprotein LolB